MEELFFGLCGISCGHSLRLCGDRKWIAAKSDERLLNSITTEAVEGAEGYRYRMSSNQETISFGEMFEQSDPAGE